jgi:hypothetical protein
LPSHGCDAHYVESPKADISPGGLLTLVFEVNLGPAGLCAIRSTCRPAWHRATVETASTSPTHASVDIFGGCFLHVGQNGVRVERDADGRMSEK